METTGAYGGYRGIMENKKETTIMVLYSKNICFSMGGNRIRTLLLI